MNGIFHAAFDPASAFSSHRNCSGSIVAVESKKLYVRTRAECVVPLAAHIEWRILHLVRVVVIAEDRVELYAGVQQRLVRLFELAAVVRGGLAAVDVVPHHQDEIERVLLARFRQQPADRVLPVASGPAISDQAKT